MAQVLENNVMGVLSGAVDSVVQTLPLVSLVGWPVLAGGNYCLATLVGLNENGVEAAWEIVKVTGRVGSALVVERGQEGLASRAWPAGTVLQLRLTAGSVATPSAVAAAVSEAMSTKVDKITDKVLSSNDFTNSERVKLANIGEGASNDRSKHTGLQTISSVESLGDRLDAALRVRILTPSNTQELLQLMWANGPGYYRVDNSNTVAPIFSAGFFSQVADTFSVLFTDYTTGNSVTVSGWHGDIESGAWKIKYLGDRSTHTGIQPFNSVDELIVFRNAYNAGGFSFDVDMRIWNQDVWYPWVMTGDKLSDKAGGGILTRALLQVATTLGFSGLPHWAKHPNGAVCNLDVEVTNCGWGTADPHPLKLRDSYAHIKTGEPPPAVYAQFANSSAHVFYLRGGARYQLRHNGQGALWEFGDNLTLNGELIAPMAWEDLKNLEQTKLPLLAIGADGSRLTNTIDSGVTSNGSWLKMKDGTMICSIRGPAGVWSYPSWFVEAPKILHSINSAASQGFSFTVEENTTEHMKCNLAWWNGSTWQQDAGEILDLVAMGRWKS